MMSVKRQWKRLTVWKKKIMLNRHFREFINFEDLLKNKEASPGAQDKIDLEELRRIKREE